MPWCVFRAAPKMYVVIYTPEDGASAEPNPMALGVYKSESKAHEKGIAKLIEDMEDKFGDKKQKKIEEWHEKLDDHNKKEFKKRLETAHSAVEEAWGGPDDAPYVVVSASKMEA